jgi:hypothetical protein
MSETLEPVVTTVDQQKLAEQMLAEVNARGNDARRKMAAARWPRVACRSAWSRPRLPLARRAKTFGWSDIQQRSATGVLHRSIPDAPDAPDGRAVNRSGGIRLLLDGADAARVFHRLQNNAPSLFLCNRSSARHCSCTDHLPGMLSPSCRRVALARRQCRVGVSPHFAGYQSDRCR